MNTTALQKTLESKTKVVIWNVTYKQIASAKLNGFENGNLRFALNYSTGARE